MTPQSVDSIIPGEKQPAVGLSKIWEDGKNVSYLKRAGMLGHLTRQALASMASSALITGISILTIGLSLFILAAFMMVVQNMSDFMSASRSELTISLYLRDGAATHHVDELRSELSRDALVEGVQFRDKKAALEEFRRSLGEDASLLSGLDEANPLPASLEVKLKSEFASEEIFRSMASKYSSHAIVDEAQYSSGLLERLSTALRTFRLVALAGMLIMLALVSFIIGNTLKLALYARGQELEIMRLVGATRAFIRAPCLIEGMLQGLAGSVLGLLLAYAAWSITSGLLDGSEIIRLLLHRIEFLSIWNMAIVIGLGLLVGAVGSYLAVKPFLHEQIDV